MASWQDSRSAGRDGLPRRDGALRRDGLPGRDGAPGLKGKWEKQIRFGLEWPPFS